LPPAGSGCSTRTASPRVSTTRSPCSARARCDLPARQRTLRATLDWSYELLTPIEQEAFVASVRGRTHAGSRPRAPLRHFLALAESTRRELWARGEGSRAFTLTRPERDNFRAALKWSIDRGRGDAALALAGALDDFWNVTHAIDEGTGGCQGAIAIAVDPPPPLLARARLCLANLTRTGPLSRGLDDALAAPGPARGRCRGGGCSSSERARGRRRPTSSPRR
jgi:hypothetical protein